MGLDIFFTEDVRNALMAADEASSFTARVCAAVGGDQVTLRAYLEGYRAALTTVALAFGLSPSVIASRGDTLEVEARTVGEALPTGGESDALSTLADDERALVCYALENLGGKFNIRDLAEAFRGRISQRRIEQLSQQWEVRGWLVAGPTRADGKRITKKLLVVTTAQKIRVGLWPKNR
jgi:hypothetical protein